MKEFPTFKQGDPLGKMANHSLLYTMKETF